MLSHNLKWLTLRRSRKQTLILAILQGPKFHNLMDLPNIKWLQISRPTHNRSLSRITVTSKREISAWGDWELSLWMQCQTQPVVSYLKSIRMKSVESIMRWFQTRILMRLPRKKLKKKIRMTSMMNNKSKKIKIGKIHRTRDQINLTSILTQSTLSRNNKPWWKIMSHRK